MRVTPTQVAPLECLVYAANDTAVCVKCRKTYLISYNWEANRLSRLGNARSDVVELLVIQGVLYNDPFSLKSSLTKQVGLCTSCYMEAIPIAIMLQQILKKEREKDGSISTAS